jgi:phosphoribosylformimino-5-aminoimidazole carboxamide ribotide isomerase
MALRVGKGAARMDVIPVIDIKNGEVVHAQGGRRDSYRPIQTPLSPTSTPSDVAAGLLRLAPFRILYIADLDAIEGRQANDAAIDMITRAAPGVELWVDNGIARADVARAWLQRWPHCLVIGSESQCDLETIRSLRGEPRVLLSLDFRGDAFQGPAALLDDASSWPARVIVMTLARVGAAAGPDLDRVSAVVGRAEGRQVFGAGGVRNKADVDALQSTGASGVLVATALHTGALTRAELVVFTG